jgi:HEAT repeat protein
MFALSQLMQRNPERALPLVLKLMNNTSSESVRRNAFFMLGMSDDPSAQQAIAQFARDSQDPELQIDAIHMLGIASNAPSMELLSSLYKESSNPEVKEAVIQAYIVGDEARPLVQLLETESAPELQSAILHGLGVMDATDELQRIYPGLSSVENRVAALQAFGMAGDTQALRQVLESETNAELRTAAIQGIAMEGGAETTALLESLYDQADSVEDKRAVLDSLMLIDEGQALALKIVQTETNVELRKQAIYALGSMDATRDLSALYASIDVVELRRAILESMSIADDIDGLIALLESETDPGLRSAAIQVLAVTNDPRASDYLLSLYPRAVNSEKQAIIQSMMIMEDAPGLMGLLNSETNPELKRQMVQLLATMESEVTEEYLFDLLEEDQ